MQEGDRERSVARNQWWATHTHLCTTQNLLIIARTRLDLPIITEGLYQRQRRLNVDGTL